MQRLYRRLRDAGLEPSYIAENALPEWWEDSLAETEAGYARAIGLIAAHTNINLDDLWNDNANITCPYIGHTNFKKSRGVTEADVQWPKCIALSAARLALDCMKKHGRTLPTKGSEIRKEIMSSGRSCVDLPSLLDFLWNCGIPVLHVSNFPAHTKKMAGLAARIDGKPVVVVCKNHPYSSLVLFDIAHEVGHILKGHVDTAVLVDSSIAANDKDPQEVEANACAMRILAGKNVQFEHPSTYVTKEKLAAMARSTGKREGIDAGVVAQNFAHGRGIYGLANGACAIIEPNAQPLRIIREKMLANLDLGALSDDDAEFLTRVAGMEGHGGPR